MSGALGSLCSGYGGLDEAVTSVLGCRLAWTSENDPDASKVLAAHHPDVPNLGDLTVVDWAGVEPVDVMCAGYPCQPFSYAGRRQGADDARHLWPHIAQAVRVLRPRLVVLENVAGHLSMGFGAVLADLAEARYDAQWCSARASDVGAPHRRERLFVVATDTDGIGRCDEQGGDGRHSAFRGEAGDHASNGALPHVAADADVTGLEGREPAQRQDVPGWGAYADAIARWEHTLCRPAPNPTDARGRLNPPFVEWMMGLDEGWVTDILTRRTAALRVLGNGVVPQQAAHALRLLLPCPGLLA